MEEAERHIVLAQTLRLKCYIMVTNVTNYVVSWDSPMINRSSQFVNSLQMDSNKLLVQNHLVKTNVDYSDEGYYRCLFIDYDKNITKHDETFIKIHDPSFKFLNLTFDRSDETFLRYPGDRVLWSVGVDAYPNPTINWVNPKGENIVESERFKIFNLPSTNGLLIKDINFNDAGFYTFKASNEVKKKILKFKLEVRN